MSVTGTIAVARRRHRWRGAAFALLICAAGCAGRGGPPVVDEAALDAAAFDPSVRPTETSTAAELTRWSEVQYHQGAHAEAIALMGRWLEAHPQAPSAVRAALAVHLEAAGQPDAAAAALQPCAKDDPAAARARTWLDLRGDGFADALEDARRAVAAAPNSAADRNNLGIALLYAGKPVEARAAFTEAHELDPALPGALYNLAIVESVYFFDHAAARNWLAAYRRLDAADPDGLFETLAGDVAVASDKPAHPADIAAREVLP